MAKWMLMRKRADFAELSKKHGVSPLFIRLLINRNITTDEEIHNYIYGDKDAFADPFLLKNMEEAVNIILSKINSGAKIRIVGDYDVDGVCSAAILKKGFDLLGADVDCCVPHRINDGYVLNINIIEKAHSDGIDTIVTCDNGISAFDEIKQAKDYGMTVVVTDHHEVSFEEDGVSKKYILPEADAIVNPKQEGDHYPTKGICGAYVAFKLISALFSKAGKESKASLDELTELAALATIADIMELRGENRELVKRGLSMMMDSKNIGLKALIEQTGLAGKKLSAYHCGFVLGPCINASGRVDTAERALELLLCDNKNDAMVMATELTELNESRKKMTQEAVEKASDIIAASNMENDKILVVYIENCHESVAGIVAGKVREKYSRPAFIITDAKEEVKGSARGVEAYNIYEEMTKVSELFIKYGGHSQAAGFSMKREDMDELRRRLNENCELDASELRDVISIDADAPFTYCTEQLVNELELMQPTGYGNSSCTFARKDVSIIGFRQMGASGKVGKYRVREALGGFCELTLFNRNEELKQLLISKYGEAEVENAFRGRGEVKFSVAYHPGWNEYNGSKSIQFIIDDFCE